MLSNSVHPLGYAAQLAAPIIHTTMAGMRMVVGWNDIAENRLLAHTQMFGSAKRFNQVPLSPWNGIGAAPLISANNGQYEPLRFSAHEAIMAFNQLPWHRTWEDNAEARSLNDDLWRNLQRHLRFCGISIGLDEVLKTTDIETEGRRNFREELEWTRLIQMSAAAAPLHTVIHDYFRSRYQDVPGVVDTDELNYNLQRHGYVREQDRNRLLKPYHHWGMHEIIALKWLGLLSQDQQSDLQHAAGLHRVEDRGIFDRLNELKPAPHMLIHWANRKLWDAELNDRYGLDQGFADSPLAAFFCKAQGIGLSPDALPDQPEGEANWAKLMYRDARHLPSIHEAMHMQHRCRPNGQGRGDSIIPGVKAWTRDNTMDMMTAHGIPKRIAESLMGTVFQPLSPMLLDNIVVEALKKADIRDFAEGVLGGEGDWVKSAFLDHGHSDNISRISSMALRAKAWEQVHGELIAARRHVREQARNVCLEQYKIGTEGREATADRIINEQFDADCAERTLATIDKDALLKIVKRKVTTLHSAYMRGELNLATVKDKLRGIGILQAQRDLYTEEWEWERNEEKRILSTHEVLKAMKDGLIQPAQALQRMVNLGWNNAEAMIELQAMQMDIQHTQALAQAHAQAHAQAEAAKQAREKARIAREQQAKAIADGKAKDKLSLVEATAIHQKLRDRSAYFESVHRANARYAEAEKTGNEEKMNAELQSEIKAYEQWLNQQYSLLHETKGTSHGTGPIETERASGPQQHQVNPDASGKGTGEPTGPENQTSKDGNPANPEPTPPG